MSAPEPMTDEEIALNLILLATTNPAAYRELLQTVPLSDEQRSAIDAAVRGVRRAR